jgi:hypothetical protein
LLDGVSSEMSVIQEEIFGSVLPFSDDEEAAQSGLTFISARIGSEKSKTCQEEEQPTEQTHYIPVPDAGYYKE